MKRFLALPFVVWCLLLTCLYTVTLWFVERFGLYDECLAILDESLREVSK